MIDHARIQTGYDIEILLNATYVQAIIGAKYDSGEIPHQIELIENILLQISRPSSFRIHEVPGNRNLEFTVSLTVVVLGVPVRSFDALVFMTVNITETRLHLSFSGLDESTRNTIRDIETNSGIPGILVEVENQLRTNLEREEEMNFLRENIRKFDFCIVSGSDGYQNAFGLYINIRFSPTLGFMDRGDLNKRLSFLPQNYSFAVGLNKATFGRFEDTIWFNLPEEPHPDSGEIIKPVKDGYEIIGEIKSITVRLKKKGFIRVVGKSEIWVDWWPDADVTAVFRYTPRVQNGIIVVDVRLVSFDVDTGLLGDLLSFIIGATVGAFLGGGVGAVIGGVGGVVALEIGEDVIATKFDDQVGAQEEGLDSAFNSFPLRVEEVSADESDPLFIRRFDVVNHINEVKVDTKGMSYAGHAVIDIVNVPEPVTIIDKERGTGAQSWNGLLSLTYRTRTSGDIVLPIEEILQRLPNRELAFVPLEPTNIRQMKTVVSDILFNSGLDLYVAESVALQDVGALGLVGYQLIHSYRKKDGKRVNAHYRARADDRKDNNFESLPRF